MINGNIETMGMKAVSSLLLWSWLVIWSNTTTSYAFEYIINADGEELGLSIADVTTGITDIRTLFIDEVHSVTVKGIEWIINEDMMNTTSSSGDGLLLWSTMVDGTVVDSGNISLTELGQLLPTDFEAGTFVVTSNRKHTVEVIMTINGDVATELVVANSYVAYQPGVSIIPMILVLVMAMTTQLVRIDNDSTCMYRLMTHHFSFLHYHNRSKYHYFPVCLSELVSWRVIYVMDSKTV